MDLFKNGQDAADYFGTALQIELLKKPFEAIGGLGKYDVIASVKGGGKSGQCGAVVHATSRALSSLDEENQIDFEKSRIFNTRFACERAKETGATGSAQTIPVL